MDVLLLQTMEFHGAVLQLVGEPVTNLVMVRLILLSYCLICNLYASGCQTTKKEACKFPFTYQGIEYNKCTSLDNNGVPWCRTANGWGNCESSCEGKESLSPVIILIINSQAAWPQKESLVNFLSHTKVLSTLDVLLWKTMEFHGALQHLDGGTVLILAHQVMYVDFVQVLFLKKKKKDFKEQLYSVSQKMH